MERNEGACQVESASIAVQCVFIVGLLCALCAGYVLCEIS